MCTLTNILSRGVGESFAVFLLPVAREFGADRGAMTSVYSTYMLVIGLMSPLAGLAVDRLGPKRCYLTGLTIFGGAFVLAGSMTALWQMVVLIGVFSAIGSTLIGMLPASTLASRWFGPRLPTAMGVLSASLGTGMLLLAPLAQWLIERWGWRSAYQIIGVTLWLVVLPMASMPWRRITAGSPTHVARGPGAAGQGDEWNVPRALRTPLFWALTGVMFFTSITTYTISVQLVACLVDTGFSSLQAAFIFGLVGMLSIVGMLGAGALAERIGERWTATISYGGTVLGLGLLSVAMSQPSVLVVGGFVALFGTMQGSRGPLVATLAARGFPGAMGRVYGMVLLGMGAGAAIGSWASGTLYDLTGGYRAGFALSAACAICGWALFWFLPVMSGSTRGADPVVAPPGRRDTAPG